MKTKAIIFLSAVLMITVAAAILLTLSLSSRSGGYNDRPDGYYDIYPIYDVLALDVSKDTVTQLSEEPMNAIEYFDEDILALLDKGEINGYERQEQTIGDFNVTYYINRHIYTSVRVSTYIVIDYMGGEDQLHLSAINSISEGHGLGFSFDDKIDKDVDGKLVLIANTNNCEGFSFNINLSFAGTEKELELEYK